jgi:hypothetical protein
MKKFKRLSSIFGLLLCMSNSEEYRKKHTYKVRFNTNFRWRDNDMGHQLRQFSVHGEPVMAYSRKDAIKRWVHADLKNRRRVKR